MNILVKMSWISIWSAGVFMSCWSMVSTLWPVNPLATIMCGACMVLAWLTMVEDDFNDLVTAIKNRKLKDS